MKASKLRIICLVFFCCSLLLSCNSDNSKKNANATAQTDSLEVQLLDPIVPLADGGAYAISHGEVWYLRGGEAIKVKKVERLSTQLSIQPATLLNTNLEKSLWAMWQKEVAKRKMEQSLEFEQSEPDQNDGPYQY